MINLYLLFIVITSYCTFITQEIIGLNEFIAEGLPLSLGFTYLLFSNKKIAIYKTPILLTLIYISYLIFLTLAVVLINQQNILKIIFVYQYFCAFILVAFIWSDRKVAPVYSEYIYYIIAILSVTSSLFGILQFLGFNILVPIDINRARGLSRSTLNFSSLAMLGFIASQNISRKDIKLICATIIFFGILSSQSRGALSAILAYFLIRYSKNLGVILLFSLIMVILFLSLHIATDIYSEINNLLILQERLENAYSTSNDLGNVQRIDTWLKIFDEFTFWGIGVGSTGPAADRIVPGTGYESFALALLAHGGVIGIIYYSLMLLSFYKIKNFFTIKLFAAIGGILVMMIVQQTYETPTVNIITWILILTLIKNEKSLIN